MCAATGGGDATRDAGLSDALGSADVAISVWQQRHRTLAPSGDADGVADVDGRLLAAQGALLGFAKGENT